MPYDLQLLDQNQVLYIRYQEDVDFETRKKVISRCVQQRPAVKRFLVDGTEANDFLAFEEKKAQGRLLHDQFNLKRAKIAYLHNPPFNPGFVISSFAVISRLDVEDFATMDAAEQWLNSGG